MIQIDTSRHSAARQLRNPGLTTHSYIRQPRAGSVNLRPDFATLCLYVAVGSFAVAGLSLCACTSNQPQQSSGSTPIGQATAATPRNADTSDRSASLNRESLHSAAAAGQIDVIGRLLTEGANINATRADGATPVEAACQAGSIEAVKLLRANGARFSGSSCLHIAAAWDRHSMAQYLIADGVPIDVVDSQGDSSLHVAATKGSTNAAEVLLEGGAEVNRKDGVGLTSYERAASNGNKQVAMLLLRAGAQPRKVDLAQEIQWLGNGLIWYYSALYSDATGNIQDARDRYTEACLDFDLAVSYYEQSSGRISDKQMAALGRIALWFVLPATAGTALIDQGPSLTGLQNQKDILSSYLDQSRKLRTECKQKSLGSRE